MSIFFISKSAFCIFSCSRYTFGSDGRSTGVNTSIDYIVKFLDTALVIEELKRNIKFRITYEQSISKISYFN